MDFKDLIYNRRTELNLTMEELGKKVGVSRATVQRWESGEIKNVRRDKIAKLADALQSTPSYLMGWDEEQVFPKNLKNLIQNKDIDIQKLSKETNIDTYRINQFLGHTDDPTFQEVKLLATYFHIDIDKLLNSNIKNFSLSDDKTEKYIYLISQLNDLGKEKVQEYINDLLSNEKYRLDKS